MDVGNLTDSGSCCFVEGLRKFKPKDEVMQFIECIYESVTSID